MKNHLRALDPLGSAKVLLLGGALTAALWGCRKDLKEDSVSQNPSNITQASPASFTYRTASPVEISITGHNSAGQPLRMKNVEIFTKNPAQGGRLITRGFTSIQGEFKTILPLPGFLNDVYVKSNYIGVQEGATVRVSGNRIRFDFTMVSARGARMTDECDGFPYDATQLASTGEVAPVQATNSTGIDGGRPCYTSFSGPPPNVFSDSYNAQLAEGNPDKIADKYVTTDRLNSDLKILTQVDNPSTTQTIKVTFLGEIASQRNTLGYYYYPDYNHPPTTIAQIQALDPKIVFPNASSIGGNGELLVGDQITLGDFQVGGAIGWFVVANGWDGSGKINLASGKNIYSSNTAFNPEASTEVTTFVPLLNQSYTRNLKQHMANVNYPHGSDELIDNYLGARGGTVFGFEDKPNGVTPNQNGAGDSDFNDIMFYVTPSSDFTDVTEIPGGVTESPIAQGTLLFEDLWPTLGDYDMNDLVTSYDFRYGIYQGTTVINNGQTEFKNASEAAKDGDIQYVNARFKYKALGAGYKNAFAIQFPFKDDGTVTGFTATISDGNNPPFTVTKLAGELLYTLILNQNAYQAVNGFPSGNGISIINVKNTDPIKYEFLSINVRLSLKAGIKTIGDLNTIGSLPPFNPFIMAQGGESPAIINKEVHLVNHPPTNRAVTTATPFLFGLNVPGNDDNSFAPNPSGGLYYYKTKPTSAVPNSFWALDINETANPTAVGFLWPVEGRRISDAYPQFADWASSGGTLNTGWYLPANIQTPINSNVYTK